MDKRQGKKEKARARAHTSAAVWRADELKTTWSNESTWTNNPDIHAHQGSLNTTGLKARTH